MALSYALDRCLELAKSQRQGGLLTPQDILRDVAKQTAHSTQAVQRILNAIAWVLRKHGIAQCRGFRTECEASGQTLFLLERILMLERRLVKQPIPRRWTRDEIKATVAGYLELLQAQKAGPLADIHAAFYRIALELGRTGKSVYGKMKEISSILHKHGMPHLEGLPPIRYLSKATEDAVLGIFAELDVEKALRKP